MNESCWELEKMKIHGIAWTLIILLQLDPFRKTGGIGRKKWSLRTCWQRRKAEYRRWIWPPCSPECILPQQKEILGRRRLGRAWPHMKNSTNLSSDFRSSPRHRYRHGSYWKSSKGYRNFNDSKCQFDLFSDKWARWKQWHDEDHC